MKTYIATCTKDFGKTFFDTNVEADSYTDAFVKVLTKYDEGNRDFAIVKLVEISGNNEKLSKC